MRGRLGSATLQQLAFPGESNLNFPWEKSYWDNTVVKSNFKKSKSKYNADHDKVFDKKKVKVNTMSIMTKYFKKSKSKYHANNDKVFL